MIPYFIMLFVCGIPLLFMEFAIGQYTRQGPIGALDKLCPFFKVMSELTVQSWQVSDTRYCVSELSNKVLAWRQWSSRSCCPPTTTSSSPGPCTTLSTRSTIRCPGATVPTTGIRPDVGIRLATRRTGRTFQSVRLRSFSSKFPIIFRAINGQKCYDFMMTCAGTMC